MGEVLRAEIARILIREVSDPRVKNACITEVDVSPDLKNAKVFFTVSGTPSKDLFQGFKKATPFIRHEMAKSLQMRFVPELHFEWDEHGIHVDRLMSLFEEIKTDSNSKEAEQSGLGT